MNRLQLSITRTLLMTLFLSMAYIIPASAQSSNYSIAMGGKTFTGVGEVLKIEINFGMEGVFCQITAELDNERLAESLKVSLENSNILEISLTESVDGGSSTTTVFHEDVSTDNGTTVNTATLTTTTSDGKTSKKDEIEVTTKQGGTITIVVGDDGEIEVYPSSI